MKDTRIKAILYAFLAALFYAVNVPFAKLLLADAAPTFMAAFLYLGAGIGVGIMYLFRFRKEKLEQKLGRKDIPYTFAIPSRILSTGRTEISYPAFVTA
mgnify:CR=1 FL=1